MKNEINQTRKPIVVPIIMTIEQISETTPGLCPKSIRNFLTERKTNGLSSSCAVIKIGKRLWLDQEKFLAWFFSHTEKN